MPYDARTQSYYVTGSLPDFVTTTNVYVAVGTWTVGHFGTKRMRFTATDNNLLVKVLGSFDEGATYPIEVVAQFAVNVGTPVIQTITATDLYTDLQVQVDPAVDNVHGTLSTLYAGWSR